MTQWQGIQCKGRRKHVQSPLNWNCAKSALAKNRVNYRLPHTNSIQSNPSARGYKEREYKKWHRQVIELIEMKVNPLSSGEFCMLHLNNNRLLRGPTKWSLVINCAKHLIRSSSQLRSLHNWESGKCSQAQLIHPETPSISIPLYLHLYIPWETAEQVLEVTRIGSLSTHDEFLIGKGMFQLESVWPPIRHRHFTWRQLPTGISLR